MATIPKHEATTRPRKGKKQSPSQPPTPANPTNVVVTGPLSDFSGEPRSMQHDIHVEGLGDVATHLDWIGDAVARLTHTDQAVTLSVSQGSNTNPVQLTLSSNDYDDTMGRLVTAFERIADSVAKLAGLSRPRLESWHEQEEYEPRFKAIACDGGAPGPKVGK